MFGYVRVARGELRVREYEYYRASYCGFCRAMGKCTGQCSRLTLSYDFAFLVNLRMALTGEKAIFRRRRCFLHPFRRRVMMERNAALEFAARAAAILVYEKFRDDRQDERGLARAGAFWKGLFARPAYRRARKKLPELALAVRETLTAFSERERGKNATPDTLAALFGELLATIASFDLPENAARIARIIGHQTGRFIYLADAIDDLPRDRKKHRFNPFAAAYGGEMSGEEKKEIEAALLAGLADMETAFDLLEGDEDSTRTAILKNILYIGMPQTAREVLYGKPKRKEGNF